MWGKRRIRWSGWGPGPARGPTVWPVDQPEADAEPPAGARLGASAVGPAAVRVRTVALTVAPTLLVLLMSTSGIGTAHHAHGPWPTNPGW